jgi:hypothetical protein
MIYSSNFFPCIDYFRALLTEDTIQINIGEQYKKQSYRTRAYILGPHKIETINVPVRKYKNNEIIKNIEIDYSENWNIKAWRTLETSYRNSPYFEYFEDLLREVFFRKHERLVDLNHESMTICLKILGLGKTIWQQEFSYYDNKNQFISFNAKNRLENMPFIAYTQIFGNKFEPNLSILDLIFSKGRKSVEFLNPENQMANI